VEGKRSYGTPLQHIIRLDCETNVLPAEVIGCAVEVSKLARIEDDIKVFPGSSDPMKLTVKDEPNQTEELDEPEGIKIEDLDPDMEEQDEEEQDEEEGGYSILVDQEDGGDSDGEGSEPDD
jgi:hypothetical protein